MIPDLKKLLAEVNDEDNRHKAEVGRLHNEARTLICDNICPYKEGQRIEAYGLDGQKGIFVIDECDISDEDPLNEILDPNYDTHLWMVIAFKEGVNPKDAGLTDKCYIHGDDDQEDDRVTIL